MMSRIWTALSALGLSVLGLSALGLSVLGLSVLGLASCKPKGSGTPPDVRPTTSGLMLKHPNFEGHLDLKLDHSFDKGFVLTIEATGFPAKGTSLTPKGGAEVKLTSGRASLSAPDITASLGHAPADAVKGHVGIETKLGVHVSVFDGRQTLDATFPPVLAGRALTSCLAFVEKKPCVFPGEGPANAKPIVALVSGDDVRFIGVPATVSAIDWVASRRPLDPKSGRKCRMARVTSNEQIEDELPLILEREDLVVFDRRTGAKVHSATIEAPDRCPVTAKVKFEGKEAGLRSAIDDRLRDQWIASFLGDGPAPTAVPEPSEPPTKKSKTKKK